jgi:hypothetical protein
MTTSYGEVPGMVAPLAPHSPSHRICDAYPESSLDRKCVLMNTKPRSITPKAIQDLLDELEASKQSRLRAWNALQRLRLVLSEVGNVAIPTPIQKTVRGRRRDPGTCFDQILPDSE